MPYVQTKTNHLLTQACYSFNILYPHKLLKACYVPGIVCELQVQQSIRISYYNRKAQISVALIDEDLFLSDITIQCRSM